MAEHANWNSTLRLGGHHIARGLADRGNQVSYVSTCITPFNAIEIFQQNQRRDVFRKFHNHIKGGTIHESGVFSYVPLALFPLVKHPIFDNRFIADNYLKLTFPRLSSFLNQNGPYDAIIVGNAKFIPLIPEIKAKQTILRFVDDVTEFRNSPKSLTRLVKKGLTFCDQVIVTANTLKEKYAYPLKKIHYVPNGVDFDFFNSNKFEEPLDIAHIPHPRAIYVGSIADWFDFELVCKAAEKIPELSFIIIGKTNTKFHKSGKFNNLHFIGARLYDTIPEYLNHSDIGIIPFKKTPLVNGVNPIKLFEYMACGLPVVATSWDELKMIESPALTAESHEDFIFLIKHVIQSKVDSNIYKSFAKRNTWQIRVEAIESILKNFNHK